MKAVLLCARCNNKMSGKKCRCGSTSCYVNVYHKGQHSYRRDINGSKLDYESGKQVVKLFYEEIGNGTFKPSTFMSEELEFELQLEKWLDEKRIEVAMGERSKGTLDLISGYAHNYYVPFFQGMSVREIDFDAITRFKQTLFARKIKTRRMLLATLSGFFRWLRARSIITDMPVFPRTTGDDTTPRRALNQEQQERALQRIPEEFRDIFAFGMETGLRSGELCTIKIKDLDMANKQALIQRTWSRRTLKDNTKTNMRNWIPLSDAALEILKRNIEEKDAEDFVFTNPRSARRGPYRLDSLGSVWRASRGTEFQNVTIHELIRHSFCTQIVELGINVLQAKALMRHADIHSTERYFHHSVSKLREVVNMRGKRKETESAGH